MIELSDGYLMFIEPKDALLMVAVPVNDIVTKTARQVFSKAVPNKSRAYKGVHRCVCGLQSDNYDYILPDGTVTNSLLVHYVQYHRHEVPRSELAKLAIQDAKL